MSRPGRVIAAAASAVAFVVIAGCGGDGSTGGVPTPIDQGSGGEPSTTPSTPAASATTQPSKPATTPTPAGSHQIVVVAHKFKDMPAVRAFVTSYPLYFKTLVDKDTDALRAIFPAYFYADTEAQISIAKDAGWVMRPPGSIVLREVETLPDGKVRISSCRSQRTEYWNPQAKKWVRNAPKGSPDVIVMAPQGGSWVMYRWLTPPASITCGSIHYPA